MHIALVLERFDIHRGGAERSTFEMACCLHALGAQVTIVAGSVDTHDVDTTDINVVSLGAAGLSRGARWRHFERAVAAHIAGQSYDIVHSIPPLYCADIYQPRGGSIAAALDRHAAAYGSAFRRAQVRFTATLNRGRTAQIAAERRLCVAPNGPIIAALSDYVADQFRNRYGLADSRIALVRNGVRIERFTDPEAHARARTLRDHYDPDGRKTIFLYAAENFHLKGLAWLLESFALAAAKHPDMLLMVFGRENYQRYYRQARRLGIGRSVLFMGTTSDIPAVMAMADAVVLPTYGDACSRVIMEGLAAGTPGITTAFNGAAEFLSDGRYGRVIAHCPDVAALSSALSDLCDPAVRSAMTAAIAADDLAHTVSMARHTRELTALYDSVAARKHNSP